MQRRHWTVFSWGVTASLCLGDSVSISSRLSLTVTAQCKVGPLSLHGAVPLTFFSLVSVCSSSWKQGSSLCCWSLSSAPKSVYWEKHGSSEMIAIKEMGRGRGKPEVSSSQSLWYWHLSLGSLPKVFFSRGRELASSDRERLEYPGSSWLQSSPRQ